MDDDVESRLDAESAVVSTGGSGYHGWSFPEDCGEKDIQLSMILLHVYTHTVIVLKVVINHNNFSSIQSSANKLIIIIHMHCPDLRQIHDIKYSILLTYHRSLAVGSPHLGLWCLSHIRQLAGIKHLAASAVFSSTQCGQESRPH